MFLLSISARSLRNAHQWLRSPTAWVTTAAGMGGGGMATGGRGRGLCTNQDLAALGRIDGVNVGEPAEAAAAASSSSPGPRRRHAVRVPRLRTRRCQRQIVKINAATQQEESAARGGGGGQGHAAPAATPPLSSLACCRTPLLCHCPPCATPPEAQSRPALSNEERGDGE